MHGAGGVGGDELHVVLGTLAVVGAAILLVGAGTQHDAGPEGGGEEQVDEAGAGHLDLGEDAAVQCGQVGDEGVGDHLRGLAPGARAGHGDVGGDVAVLDVGGDLYDEGGQLGLGQGAVGHRSLGGGGQQGAGLVQRGLPGVVVLVGLFKVGHFKCPFVFECEARLPQEPQAKNNEKSVDVLYRHFQRVAADDAGVVGVQQVAERRAAALLGQLAVDAVAGDAQSEGAHLRLVVAEIAAVPLDEELAVGPPEPEQGHPAAVLGDLDGSGAALEADGLRLLIRDVVASVLFGKAAPGHQLDVVAVLLADDALIVELVDGALDADNVVFQWFAHSFASLSVFINGDLVDEPALVLTEEEIGGLGEAVRHVADVEVGLALFVISLQPMLAERPLQMVGGGLGRVHEGDVPAHVPAYHLFDEGVVGAAEDEGVHPGLPHLGQILGDDQTGHLLLVEGAVVHITGLHEGDEEGTGTSGDLHAGDKLPQQGLITAGTDGGRRADDADTAVAGDEGGLPGGGVHDAQIGDGELRGLGGGVDAGHRAAGGHDALDILREQERDVLPCILQNSLRAAAAVGDAAGIAEVDDILVGEALAQLPHAGQTAKAAVEYADGTVIHAAFPSFPEPER